MWESRWQGTSGGGEKELKDRHPAYLKERGDRLFKQMNFKAAITAYSEALDLDPSFLPCLSNRAACHFNLQSYT